jgi:alpha-beta hydrolase superfamily lysophospholipase
VHALLGALTPTWERLATTLPTLALPVLAVHGTKDEIAPADGVRSWQPRLAALRLELIDDATHDVLNEVAHRQVADLIARFALDAAASRG